MIHTLQQIDFSQTQMTNETMDLVTKMNAGLPLNQDGISKIADSALKTF